MRFIDHRRPHLHPARTKCLTSVGRACHAKSGPGSKVAAKISPPPPPPPPPPRPKVAAKYSPPKQIMVPLPDQNWQQKMVPLHTEVSPPTHNLNTVAKSKIYTV